MEKRQPTILDYQKPEIEPRDPLLKTLAIIGATLGIVVILFAIFVM